MVLSQHMILMVGSIRFDVPKNIYIIELTDGWYSLHVVLLNLYEKSKSEYYAKNNKLLIDLMN